MKKSKYVQDWMPPAGFSNILPVIAAGIIFYKLISTGPAPRRRGLGNSVFQSGGWGKSLRGRQEVCGEIGFAVLSRIISPYAWNGKRVWQALSA